MSSFEYMVGYLYGFTNIKDNSQRVNINLVEGELLKGYTITEGRKVTNV